MHAVEGFEHSAQGFRALPTQPEGHFMYGPYAVLPAGHYRAIIELQAEVRDRRRPVIVVDATPVGATALAEREFGARDVSRGSIAMDFDLPTALSVDESNDHPLEIRLAHRGNARILVTRVALEKAKPRRRLRDALALFTGSR
jgi:hypothetical protein